MNLVLLFDSDFAADDVVVLRGRRRDHIAGVHRAAPGDALVVGLAGGRVGVGTIERLDAASVEMRVVWTGEPPPALSLTLVLAVPRPKVLNRVIAGAVSMGVKRIALINAWRVEKSYWKSPRLAEENLRTQCVAGLEQAKDTMFPLITQHRFFRSFVEEELDELAQGSSRLIAHPAAVQPVPVGVQPPVTLAIGPEGGFIAEEIASFERAGFMPMSLGPRVLRVETAVAALIATLTKSL
jgi:16S rRNA (uracil1498-N3)-methyltransferase